MKPIHFVFLLFCIALCVSQSEAQWVRTSGPPGGDINCLAVSGENVFASDGAAVFRSTDNGSTWTAIDSGLTNLGISALAVSGINLFAGTSVGVFRSRNNGNSWTPVNSGLTNYPINAFGISGTNIFAATGRDVNGGGSGQVFLSTNGGTSWTLVNNGLPIVPVHFFAANGASIFAATADPSFESSIYRSTNNGTSWTELTFPRDSNGYCLSNKATSLAACGGNVFAGTWTGVCRSTDDGMTWTGVNNGFQKPDWYSLGPLAVGGSKLFAGISKSGVYLTADYGMNWIRAVDSGLTNLTIHALAASGTNLFAGTKIGLFRSTNEGSNWTRVVLPASQVVYVGASGTNLFAETVYQSGGTGGIPGMPVYDNEVFRTTDGGASWTAITEDVTHTRVTSLKVCGAYVFAWNDSGGSFRSTDNGIHWAVANTPFSCGEWEYVVPHLVMFQTGVNLFAGTLDGDVYLSTDGGTNWDSVHSVAWRVTSFAAIGTNLFVGTDGVEGVLLSTNNGVSWTAVNSGLTTTVIRSLATIGTTLLAGSGGFWDPTGGGVFRSTNNGTSWTLVSGLTATSFVVCGANILAATGDTYGSGSSPGEVYLSTNDGTSWAAVESGLTGWDASSLASSGTNLYAGTLGGGVWRRPLSEMITAVGPVTSELPREFLVAQNYPNPFNPSTTIKYELPRSSMVTLSVYDMLGRVVSVLLNERRDGGVHEVKFDGASLASGVYFYRLRAGDYVETKRMLLLR